jgi:hypothetical protein
VSNLSPGQGEYVLNIWCIYKDAYSRQGEYVLQQDQGKNVSSLTLMSKGEKRVWEESRLNVRMHVGACIAINAKGGDCWQIFNRQRMENN